MGFERMSSHGSEFFSVHFPHSILIVFNGRPWPCSGCAWVAQEEISLAK